MNKISLFTAAIAALTLCGCGANGKMEFAGNPARETFREMEMKKDAESKSAVLLKKAAEQWKVRDFEGCLKSYSEALACTDLDNGEIRGNTKLDIIRTLLELKRNDEAKAYIAEIQKDEKASPDLKIRALYIKCTLERDLRNTEDAVAAFREIQKQGDPNSVRLASYQINFAQFLGKPQFGCDPADLREEIYKNFALPEHIRMEAFITWSGAKGLRAHPEKLQAEIMPEFHKYFPIDKISPNAADKFYYFAIANDGKYSSAETRYLIAKEYYENKLGGISWRVTHGLGTIVDYELNKDKDYAKAIARCEAELKNPEVAKNGECQVSVHKMIANIYCCQSKPEKAIEYLKKQLDSFTYSHLKNFTRSAIYNIYSQYLMHEEGAKFARSQGDFEREMAFLDFKGQGLNRALELLRDPGTPNAFKGHLVMRFYASSNPEDKKYAAEFEKYLKFAGVSELIGKLKTAVHYGVYDDAVKLGSAIPAANRNKDVIQRMFFAYAALGDRKNAEILLAQSRGMKELLDQDVAQCEIVTDIAGAPDEAAAFDAIAKKYSRFPGKTLSELYLYAESAALAANKNNLARKIENTYQALFKDRPRKVYEVPFLERPVTGVSDFASRSNLPPKQRYDRKFGANMDFLVTDVGTGNRGSGIGSAKGEEYKPTEMQIVCDENAIHFLFTVYDSKMDQIRQGIANGATMELYISPGENQPYYCLLPNVSNGKCGIWQSSYATKEWKMIDTNDCRSEVLYQNGKALFYFQIPWFQFYDKLPDEDNCYDFENVEWSRFGGNQWNGLTGVHARDSYGKLRFLLSPAQRAAIKKRIISKAIRIYQAEKGISQQFCGSIFRWSKDPLLGDPEFYQKEMAPIQKTLDEYVMKVSPDMSDETVNEIYSNAVRGWHNFRLILQENRYRDLENKFFEE